MQPTRIPFSDVSILVDTTTTRRQRRKLQQQLQQQWRLHGSSSAIRGMRLHISKNKQQQEEQQEQEPVQQDRRPPLFQVMKTKTKTTITTTTTTNNKTEELLLYQDQAKTLHIEHDMHADAIHKIEDAARMVTDGTTTTTTTTTSTPQFAVGDVVQVIIPELRAYQVPIAGRGRYYNIVTNNDNNNKNMSSLQQFVPDPTLKYLILPIGLRGTVEKVYDPESGLSANLPIRVSFVKPIRMDKTDDTNAADDQNKNAIDDTPPPQPPVDFQMYFAASELALVERPR